MRFLLVHSQLRNCLRSLRRLKSLKISTDFNSTLKIVKQRIDWHNLGFIMTRDDHIFMYLSLIFT